MRNVVVDVASLCDSAERLGGGRLEHLVLPGGASDEESGWALPDDVFVGLHVRYPDGRSGASRSFRRERCATRAQVDGDHVLCWFRCGGCVHSFVHRLQHAQGMKYARSTATSGELASAAFARHGTRPQLGLHKQRNTAYGCEAHTFIHDTGRRESRRSSARRGWTREVGPAEVVEGEGEGEAEGAREGARGKETRFFASFFPRKPC